MIYQDKPRLKTALEMLRVSLKLEDTLHEVTISIFSLSFSLFEVYLITR